MIGLFVALLAAAAVVPGQRVPLSTPQPVFATPAPRGVAFYVMQGKWIVSLPYASAAACMKALATIKSAQQPGAPALVCAHRAP